MGGVAREGCGNHTLMFGSKVLYHVMELASPWEVWKKLESKYMSKSLTDKLYLKQKLYGLKM